MVEKNGINIFLPLFITDIIFH